MGQPGSHPSQQRGSSSHRQSCGFAPRSIITGPTCSCSPQSHPLTCCTPVAVTAAPWPLLGYHWGLLKNQALQRKTCIEPTSHA